MHPLIRLTFACLLAGSAHAADKNTSGLPTYPGDQGGIMDTTPRTLPNGQHCTHYASDTPDALAKVESWYRQALPAAKVDDINHDSMYAGFKLDGIKLLSGNDTINIYRSAPDQDTAIEIFKCSDAAKSER